MSYRNSKAESDIQQQTPSRDPAPSQPQIENIEIIELLGTGGMSLVYKARQKQLDRIVAVKVLSKLAVSGEDGIKRFQKEARLTSTLEHPNIVKTMSFGLSEDGQPYLVMEYLDGLSLADELKQNGRLTLQKFKEVFLPALSALNQAHNAGLVHRDIKPGNIMICRNDTGVETVKLVDFGIAKVFDGGASETQQLTKSGAVMGSPSYMSPEQCLGKPLDGRSDLYSIACVMYEALSGEPPFSGHSPLEVMQKHGAEPPPTVSDLRRKIDIHEELAKVTLWGLAKNPTSRPQTASEFARKIEEVLQRIRLDQVPRLRMQSQLRSSIKRHLRTLVVVVSVSLFSIMLLSGGIMLWSHFKRTAHPITSNSQSTAVDWTSVKATYNKATREFKNANNASAGILYRKTADMLEHGLVANSDRKKADRTLCECYCGLARSSPPDADECWRRSLSHASKGYGLQSQKLAEVQYLYAYFLTEHAYRAGVPEALSEAESLCRQSRGIYRQLNDRLLTADPVANAINRTQMERYSSRLRTNLSLLGLIHEKQGEAGQAVKELQESLQMRNTLSENDDYQDAWILERLCKAHNKDNNPKEEEASLKMLVSTLTETKQISAGEKASYLNDLIDFYTNIAVNKERVKWLQQQESMLASGTGKQQAMQH